MKKYNYVMVLAIILLLIGCEKEEVLTSNYNLLQNNKGWYCFEYKRHDIKDETEFETIQPYIIIGEYGSGFKLKEDGICHINYSDGNRVIEEGVITREWKMSGDHKIIFISQSSEDINVAIVEMTNETLWIKYEQSGDNWEYKLRKIE